MTGKQGFSLLEISIVIFIMGLTITALLQMFDWSHIRYREIANGWQERVFLAEVRLWLRERVMNSEFAVIDKKTLSTAIKAPENFKFAEVDLTQHDPATVFIRVGYFYDQNRNNKAETSESASRLFCFRRRSA